MASQGSISTNVGVLQRSRWVFTLNNYDIDYDYRSHICKPEFHVLRAILGYEVGDNGTRHIQGMMCAS